MIVVIRRSRYLSGLVLLLLLAWLAGWADAQDENGPSSEIRQWLDRPNRQDFDWNVRLFGPWLSFQQRHVAEVEVVLPVRKLVRAGLSLSDLHFALKVKDDHGRWLPGEYHSLFAPPPDMAQARDILLYTHFLLRPGTYTIVLAVYDEHSHKGNVGTRQVQVLTKDNLLPEAGRDLPEVEFPFGSHENPSASRDARLFLPVRTQQPVRLDVVLNLSLSDAMNTHYAQASDWVYRTNAGRLLQIGKVLSQFDLKEGCIRISAIDILRQKIFADRISSTEMNWRDLMHSVETLERHKIDVRVLAQQKDTPTVFARFLEKVSADPVSCGQPGRIPVHVLVVVSDAFLFPGKTQMARIRTEVVPGTTCYYLQMDPVVGATWDQIGQVLSPLHPRRWEFSDAAHFRKVIAELIAGLESMPSSSPQNQSQP